MVNIKDLRIESSDFRSLEMIPERYAADKGNIAPSLLISGVPSDAVELAVICHDPDAPLPDGFTHWIVYGISPTTAHVDSNTKGIRIGPNGLNSCEYFGPQPPTGHGAHHYYFWIYALNTKVTGTPTRQEFLTLYGNNILEQNRVVALYENAA